MDKYNHWVGKLFKSLFGKGSEYAVTLGQTTYYSCPAGNVGSRWEWHENKHKEQWARDGRLKFALRYVWQWVVKGHDKIDYEIETSNI